MMPSPHVNPEPASTSFVDATKFYLHPASIDTVPKPVSPNGDRSTEGNFTATLPTIEFSKTVFSDQQSEQPYAQPAKYFCVKTWVDRLGTVGLMLFATPLLIVIGIAVLVLDGRPIFFRQVRVGKDGNRFNIWKFRTMHRNAEACTGAVWSSKGDTRVTKLGRWLRQTHLDELPQFFNVLKGDMNLVGPRPERPEFVKRLSAEFPHYNLRSQVRPGITGLAQLRLGYDESIKGVRKKIQCDLEYIHSTTFFRDLILLGKTIPHITWQLVRSRLCKTHETAASADVVASTGHAIDQNLRNQLLIHPAEDATRRPMSMSTNYNADNEVA